MGRFRHSQYQTSPDQHCDLSPISPPVQERVRMLVLWPQAATVSSAIVAANSAGIGGRAPNGSVQIVVLLP